MTIVKLILHKYKRVLLSDIETITYTPDSNLQLILGTNGSGKSSLVSQLSPLPGNKSDFLEDGYKYIEIDHHGSLYKLSNYKIAKNKHSFIVDNKELNDGGTLRVQLELVNQHFNITPNIQNVLLGYDNFTTMSPANRKKWLTMLSDVDYSYSIGIYNKIKNRHRDIVGGIKLLQNNIVQSERLLLSDDTIAYKNEQISYLKKMIDHLISSTTQVTDRNYELSRLEELSIEISKIYSYSNDLRSIDSSVIDNKLVWIKSKLNSIEDSIATTNSKITNSTEPVSSEHKSELVTRRDSVYSKIQQYNVYLPYNGTELVRVIDVWDEVYMEVVGILSRLSEYSTIDSSSDVVNGYKRRYEIVTASVRSVTNKLEPIRLEVEKHKQLHSDDNLVTCPKCSNIWHLNYNEDAHKSYEEQLEQLVIELDKLKLEESELEETLSTISSKLAVIQELRNITGNYNSIRDVWKYIYQDVDIHTDGVITINNRVEKINQDMSNWKELTRLTIELDNIDNELDKIKLVDTTKQELILAERKQLEEELTRYVTDKNNYQSEYNKYIKYQQQLNKLKGYYNELYKTLNNANRYKDLVVENMRNKYLNEAVMSLKGILVEIEAEVNGSNRIKSKLATEQRQLEEYNVKEKVLKIALRELSPTEGLIAKSIYSFLDKFVSDMNSIISKVWSTPMRITAPVVDDDNDLNYKFKIITDHSTVEDISKGSSGMKEIIDLAYKIVFMKYMGLEDTPLVLDEFAKAFDTSHRKLAYDVIDKIISSNFSQLFIISHFSSVYGRFVNADMIVMNPDNIDLSGINKYNEVIVFE